MVSEAKFINKEAPIFERTSQKFLIPITILSKGLQEAVASAIFMYEGHR